MELAAQDTIRKKSADDQRVEESAMTLAECREAAAKGDFAAQSQLAYWSENGIGVEKSLSDALSWYYKAAEHVIEAELQSGAGWGVQEHTISHFCGRRQRRWL